MSKGFKSILSAVLVFSILLLSTAIPVPFFSKAATDLTNHPEVEDHLPEKYYDILYDLSDICYETVDNIDYIFIIEDGTATILNIHIQHRGPEKIVLTLPTTLGGYPVTTIGNIIKEYNQYGREVTYWEEVFWYMWYGEDVDLEFGEFFPDYDPGLNYISKIVIPEGYQYIEDCAFMDIYVPVWFLPKSLKRIGKDNFWNLKVEGNPENTFFYPECEFTNSSSSGFWGAWEEKMVIASRYTIEASPLLYFNYQEQDKYYGYSGELYLPANMAKEQIFNMFFSRAPELGESGGIIANGVTATIHCAPDCEWLSVFDTETYNGNFYYRDQVVTDVVPATSIAFSRQKVYINVGEYKDIEAKTYPAEAMWTACDYVSSDPDIVKVDEYSGRITALKEGTATITATHCERDFTDSYEVTVLAAGEVAPTEPEHNWSNEWTYDENDHWRSCEDDGCTAVHGLESHTGGSATLDTQAICKVCGASYGELKPAVTSVNMLGKAGYFKYESREYSVSVTGSPTKIQVIRPNGATVTFTRSQAVIEKSGDDEIWTVVLRLNEGQHRFIAKYGKAWNHNGDYYTVEFDDKPSCHSCWVSKEDKNRTFYVTTDKEVEKIRFVNPFGTTMTYTQNNSYIGEDGLRYWTFARRMSTPTKLELMLKYSSQWYSADKFVNV